MANVKSAEKRNRQNIKRRERNRANRSEVKTVAQKAFDAIRKDAKAAAQVLSDAASVIAKSAHKGAIPKGRASRKISRLAKARNKALSGRANA
jgi:small subunit ribosomal protein S20